MVKAMIRNIVTSLIESLTLTNGCTEKVVEVCNLYKIALPNNHIDRDSDNRHIRNVPLKTLFILPFGSKYIPAFTIESLDGTKYLVAMRDITTVDVSFSSDSNWGIFTGQQEINKYVGIELLYLEIYIYTHRVVGIEKERFAEEYWYLIDAQNYGDLV